MNEIYNFYYSIQGELNKNKRKICIGRDVFDERNESFDFIFLDAFIKMIYRPFSFFSFSCNKMLISLII